MDTANHSTEVIEIEISTIKIDGTGRLKIENTGGTSSSEGGMGSGNDDDTSKGDLSKPGEKSGATNNSDEGDEKWDPIGKNIKEKEKNSGE